MIVVRGFSEAASAAHAAGAALTHAAGAAGAGTEAVVVYAVAIFALAKGLEAI